MLETQMGALRATIQTHPDSGLHGLRHTFLTCAGGCTDPFTLQYVAGHDSIKTTMCNVHPQANGVQDLFLKLVGLPGSNSLCGMGGSAGSVQNPVQLQLLLTVARGIENKAVFKSGSGEIGRHTILRGWRREAWGFKSPLPHQKAVSQWV